MINTNETQIGDNKMKTPAQILIDTQDIVNVYLMKDIFPNNAADVMLRMNEEDGQSSEINLTKEEAQSLYIQLGDLLPKI